jgi:hypothetical protein
MSIEIHRNGGSVMSYDDAVKSGEIDTRLTKEFPLEVRTHAIDHESRKTDIALDTGRGVVTRD